MATDDMQSAQEYAARQAIFDQLGFELVLEHQTIEVMVVEKVK
jgi:hypothetical protein